jgi:DNA-binding XRE family transcriptional regulator
MESYRQMSNFCERLKEVRKHLKLNQGAFGALAGVSAETQLNYE